MLTVAGALLAIPERSVQSNTKLSQLQLVQRVQHKLQMVAAMGRKIAPSPFSAAAAVLSAAAASPSASLGSFLTPATSFSLARKSSSHA